MKRGIAVLFLIICMSSFISADIIFTSQINPVYNLEDIIKIPVTIKTTSNVYGMFQMDLICNGTPVNFYKNGINLLAGEEESVESSLVLIREIIGENRGSCKIKAIFGSDYRLSNEFRISDSLFISGSVENKEFSPGEDIFMTGGVKKETGEESDGFIDAFFISNKDIIQHRTVNTGTFSINLTLPKDTKAGNYILRLKAFEKDSNGIITNEGSSDYSIYVKQIPTNLEIVMESRGIKPGEPAKIKAILHDQTGDSIPTSVFVTIKDSKDKIVEQKTINTEEVLEYSIRADEPPSNFQVFAASGGIEIEGSFYIEANEKIDIEIVNKTILITNTGNIPYEKTVLINIGENQLNIPVVLNVGESKKYVLSAPDGEYQVEVKTGTGDEISGIMSLTGGAVNAREIREGHYTTLAWILMILVLGFIAFNIFRKIYNKPFFERIISGKKEKKEMPILRDKKIAPDTNKAELSLSIKGDKQEASVICLKMKNLKEITSGKGSASETMSRIMDLAKDSKAVIYENQDYLFFMLAPAKTKTFKNEKNALSIAETIQNLLTEQNKKFNQKVEFGISLNYGTIIAKIENGIFKFMSMGTLISSAKKIASLSRGEILLGEKMNDLLRLGIKTDKHVREGTTVFSIREIKRENEEARKFIDGFMKRMGNK